MANCNPTATPAPPIISLAKVLVFNLVVSVRLLSPMPMLQPHWSPLGAQPEGMKRAKLTLFLVRIVKPYPECMWGFGAGAGQKGDLPFLEDRRRRSVLSSVRHTSHACSGFNLHGQCARPRILPTRAWHSGPLCLQRQVRQGP